MTGQGCRGNDKGENNSFINYKSNKNTENKQGEDCDRDSK